jgi:hypothetical protein
MAISQGLDAAILDVCDAEMVAEVATAALVLNQDIYSDGYLKAYGTGS